MIEASGRIYQAAVEKLIAEKGGFDFYGKSVDPALCEISQDGEVVLRKRGNGTILGRYPIEELGLSPELVNSELSNLNQTESNLSGKIVSLNLSDKRSVLGLCSAGLLFIGSLCPVVTLPMIGSITYIQSGRGDGVLVLIISLISAGFVIAKRFSSVRLCGIASLCMIFTTLWLFQFKISQAKELLSGLEGNPFRGLADAAIGSVGLSWGWLLLIGGAVSLLVSVEVVATDQGLALPSSALLPNSKGGIWRCIPVVIVACLVAGFALALLINPHL